MLGLVVPEIGRRGMAFGEDAFDAQIVGGRERFDEFHRELCRELIKQVGGWDQRAGPFQSKRIKSDNSKV